VHLVDDEHLAPKPEEPESRIIGAQPGEQRLVDGADAGGGEQRALRGAGKPVDAVRFPGFDVPALSCTLELELLFGALWARILSTGVIHTSSRNGLRRSKAWSAVVIVGKPT
jgi:hypothetical protein